MPASKMYDSGIYAVVCRGHIIYIGMTQRNFYSRWLYYAATVKGERPATGQEELFAFLERHKDEISFRVLLRKKEIEEIGITIPQAESVLIKAYSPIFNIIDANPKKKLSSSIALSTLLKKNTSNLQK